MTPDDPGDLYEELINALTLPMTPEEIQVASEGYTCGFIPPANRHLYLDPDWF